MRCHLKPPIEWLVKRAERVNQNMKVVTDIDGLPDHLLRNILRETVQCVHPRRVLLYGSRARGDYSARSDIDLAVEGGDKTQLLRLRLEDTVPTLLRFDVVDLAGVSASIKEEILREGIIIYEKA